MFRVEPTARQGYIVYGTFAIKKGIGGTFAASLSLIVVYNHVVRGGACVKPEHGKRLVSI
jgi:hypothetical protein